MAKSCLSHQQSTPAATAAAEQTSARPEGRRRPRPAPITSCARGTPFFGRSRRRPLIYPLVRGCGRDRAAVGRVRSASPDEMWQHPAPPSAALPAPDYTHLGAIINYWPLRAAAIIPRSAAPRCHMVRATLSLRSLLYGPGVYKFPGSITERTEVSQLSCNDCSCRRI